MALVIAFIVTFIDLLKELPITLILRPFNFDTLATQTYEFAVEEMLKASSIYSLMIIVIGSVLLILLKYIFIFIIKLTSNNIILLLLINYKYQKISN